MALILGKTCGRHRGRQRLLTVSLSCKLIHAFNINVKRKQHHDTHERHPSHMTKLSWIICMQLFCFLKGLLRNFNEIRSCKHIKLWIFSIYLVVNVYFDRTTHYLSSDTEILQTRKYTTCQLHHIVTDSV